jgi:hypothetical protein
MRFHLELVRTLAREKQNCREFEGFPTVLSGDRCRGFPEY